MHLTQQQGQNKEAQAAQQERKSHLNGMQKRSGNDGAGLVQAIEHQHSAHQEVVRAQTALRGNGQPTQ